MCVVMCMGGNSTTWMNTAVLVTCMRNFKGSRGPAAGILKAYVGLSTAIFTDLCTALFTGDAAAFVLMLAVLPFAVCIVAMFLLRPVPMSLHHQQQQHDDHHHQQQQHDHQQHQQQHDHQHRNNIAGDDEKEESRCFALLNSAAVLLALYLLAIDLSGISSSSSSAAGIALLLASPAALPIYLHFKARRKRIKPESEQQRSLKDPLLLKASCDASNGPPPASDTDASTAAAAAAKKPHDEDGDYDEESNAATTADADGENQKQRRRLELGEDHTFSEALSTSAFWLLFACFLCGVGNAMAFINNTGQIGESLGFASVSIFVSMISIWGFFGRLGSGALTEWLIR
jgi:Ca2+/Na+ antiporter